MSIVEFAIASNPSNPPKKMAGEVYYDVRKNGKVKKVKKCLRIIKEADQEYDDSDSD